MPNIAALLAPIALLFPLSAGGDAVPSGGAELTSRAQEQHSVSSEEWLMLDRAVNVPVRYQVRIQQRVIIRVSPRRPVVRQSLTAELPQRAQPPRMIERKIGKCLKMNAIAGVQVARDNRLMLFMRDQRLIAASLEKACSARDFYSGFYVEPSKDGNLCIDRDKLQSRTGAKCELSRIRQLVAEQT